MVALNFNAAGVRPNVALEAIPSGIYPVIITQSTEKPTRSGNGSYIEFEMAIQGGEYAGRKVFDRLNIRNPNQTAVDIAYSTLSAICHVTGVLAMQDTQQLHGRPFCVVVIKKERDDQPGSGNMTNEVRGYKDINGNDPGFSGNVQNQSAQPSWANNQQGQQQAPVQNQAAQIQQQPAWQQQNQAPVQQMQQPPVQQQVDPNAGQAAPPWQQQQQAQPQQQVQQQAQPQQNTGGGSTPPWAQGGQ